MKQVTQIDRGRVDIGLGNGAKLSGVTAAVSGEEREPKMVAFQQISARLTAAGMQCRSSMGSAPVLGDAAGASERTLLREKAMVHG
ncbi:hypothetical protein RA989_21190 [Mycobacteroides abscessus subsp. massiliense]